VKVNDPFWLKVLKQARYVESTLIIGFSGFIIFYGILASQSGFSRSFPNSPPALSFFVFLFLIVFFGLLEGAHVCVVDLSKHSNETFKQKYPRVVSTHSWVSGPKIFNLSKFLMGRQVMVIFTQFFLGSLVSFPAMVNFPFTDIPFPALFKKIFVDTGLMNVTFVTTFGSLVPQLIATRYPVQFMNLYAIRVITAIGLVLEATGIAHFSWVLHHLITKVFGMDHGVTKRVMADSVEMEVVADPDEGSEDIQQLPQLKNAKGKWKDSYEIAQEWRRLGYKIPSGLSNGSPEVISQMLQVAQANPKYALAAKTIVYC